MIDVSDEIKQAYDMSTTQVDKIILNDQEYRITNVEFYDDVYNEGNIFGTAIAKCLEFQIENIVDLEGKEVEYQTGIIVNGVTQWISLGNFIIQDIEPNDTTNIVKVFAMDYMLKSNTPYQSNLNYGDGTVTLLDVLQEACTNCELTLATMEFPNSDFIVDSNQFAEGTLNKQVFQAVAQISGTIAKIKNNELHLIGPGTEISKVFTLNNYEEAEIKRATHPMNLVSLGMADVEGENVVLRDEASITTNGENSLIINDNPFAYTQAKREQLITALFDAVRGFEYKAYSFKCQGLPYLETMDKVQFLDKEGNTYDSYVFRFNYKSPNGLESTIEAPSIIRATVAYQNVLDALEISKRTEILVNKQEQIIQSVVSQTDDQNQKISEVTQTVNELNSKISDIADITTSKESTNGTVSFEKVNQSEPIYVRIYPTGENISYLYPHANLFPSETLFLKVRTLRFTNTTTNEYFDYELPTDLLYHDTENYDEFILDYDAQSCVVNKRVGYNADGTTYVLDAVKTIEYEYPRIELTDGDYTIELLGYHNAYLFVRLMAQNMYTTQWATRAELNSEIKQTVQEVDIGVDKKLSNYSTTTQMNAAINVKANQITESVAATYATQDALATEKSERTQTATEIKQEVSKKVGEDEVISKINQSVEAVGINANKIELSANDVLNLLAGNTINISGKKIKIESDGFNVDENGNVTILNSTENAPKMSIKQTAYDIDLTTRILGLGLITSPSSDKSNWLQRLGITKYTDTEGNTELIGKLELNNYSGTSSTEIYPYRVRTPELIQTSKESKKKNILEYNEKALDIVKDSIIYEFNFKNENDKDKKHLGFVIGDEGGEYKTPEQVISNDREGIESYSMTSILWKAVQEQQQLIEQLQNEIKELKKESE